MTESTVAFVAEGEGKKNLLKVTGNMLVNEHGVVSMISTYVLLGFDDVAVMSDWLGIFKSTVTNLRLIGSPNQKSNRHSQQSFTFTNVNGGSGGSEADTERSSRPLSSDSYSSLMSSNQLPDTPPSSSLFGSFPTPPSLVPTAPSNYQIQNKRTKRGPPSLSPPNFPLPPLPFVGFTDSNAS